MTPSPLTAALIVVGLGIAVAGAYAWLIAGGKAALTWGLLRQPIAGPIAALLQSLGFAPRLPLVPWTARQPVTWGLIDLVGIVGLLFVAGALLDKFNVVPDGKIEDLTLLQMENRIAWNVGLSLLLAVVSVALVMIRTGAASRDLGWSWRDVPGDIRLGLSARFGHCGAAH